jgi:hypothetical protein
MDRLLKIVAVGSLALIAMKLPWPAAGAQQSKDVTVVSISNEAIESLAYCIAWKSKNGANVSCR